MFFVLRKLAGAAFVIFGAITMVFLILYWLPGDPATLIAGDGATAETIARIRDHLGIDRPLWQNLFSYIAGLAHGDLGISFSTNAPVLGQLWAQLPSTLALAGITCAVAIIAGVLLGVVAAVGRGNAIDHAIQAITLFFTSMPSFWLGILLILIFSVTLQWLPARTPRSSCRRWW